MRQRPAGAETMSRDKGARYENRLVDFLDMAEFTVMKAPSSGSGTSRAQPDVLAVRQDEAVVFELKYVGETDGIIYLEPEEIVQLRKFARGVDAIPRVATRWYRDPAFYVWNPDVLGRTDSGKFRVDRDLVEQEQFEDVLADGEEHGLDGGGHGMTPLAVRDATIVGRPPGE